jgi:hypothetical protein
LFAIEAARSDIFIREYKNQSNLLHFQWPVILIAASFILEIGVAKSGVKGPFKCGSNLKD